MEFLTVYDISNDSLITTILDMSFIDAVMSVFFIFWSGRIVKGTIDKWKNKELTKTYLFKTLIFHSLLISVPLSGVFSICKSVDSWIGDYDQGKYCIVEGEIEPEKKILRVDRWEFDVNDINFEIYGLTLGRMRAIPREGYVRVYYVKEYHGDPDDYPEYFDPRVIRVDKALSETE